MFKKIKLSIVTIGIFLALAGTNIAHADFAGDLGKWVGSAFNTGEEGLSFTQYEGEGITLEPEDFDSALTTSNDAREFVIRIVNYALGFLGLIAVLVVIYGGVLYVTSAGDDEKTGEGKKAIQYAAIGLIIVMGSFAFVNTVIQGAGGSGENTGTSLVITGGTTGGGFNASAEQVRTVALDIYNGFAFVAESSQTITNILNELGKSSLNPDNFPTKENILAFLRSSKTQLQNMQARVQPFSETSIALQNLIRDFDTDIDKIQSLKEPWSYKPGGDSCDPGDDSDGFEEGFDEGVSGKIRCDREGYTPYNKGLYEAWKFAYLKYGDQNPVYPNDPTTIDVSMRKPADIIIPIRNDYEKKLLSNLVKLQSIYDSVGNISAVKAGKATSEFNSMMYAFGCEPNSLAVNQESNAECSSPSSGVQGVLQIMNGSTTGTLTQGIDKVGAQLLAALEHQSNFFNELKSLVYVQARLTANTVTGNSPLTVIFDTLGTVDPAGGSIDGNSIIWDLAGTLKYDELAVAERNGSTPAGNVPADGVIPNPSINCSLNVSSVSGQTEEQLIGSTSKRCRFEKPGTYTAAIKVDSKDPAQFAPGISILTIKVLPPTTKINLALTPQGGETQQVMQYQEDSDVLLVDKKVITVIASQAANGVSFDASKTGAERYRWNFGDGNSTEFSESPTTENVYTRPGKYEVSLEVLSPLGVVDIKNFTLQVAGVAARINTPPVKSVFINKAITFDGSQSRSDLGGIKEYKWVIAPSEGQALPTGISEVYPVEEAGSNLTTFEHAFKYPLDYDITLTVTDTTGAQAVDTIEAYSVISQKPVAQFDFSRTDASQPATFQLDAAKSYDPDGQNDFLEYRWSVEGADNDTWSYVDDTSASSEKPVMKFNKKGDYTVKLRVSDSLTQAPNEEFDEVTSVITVDNVLDLSWGDNQQVTGFLTEAGETEMTFDLVSENAVAYEIDFGDGDTESGDISQSKSIKHTYTEGGRYTVRVTVYDIDDNDNSIQRRIFIGGGDNPIAKISVQVNGVEALDLSTPVTVLKNDQLTFDAGESRNTDGTGRKLKYSWDLGDGTKSAERTVSHRYNELTPNDNYYTVKLQAYDQDQSAKSDMDEVRVRVVSAPPKIGSIQAIPIVTGKDLTTPIAVNLRAYGVEDPDGQVTQYKWWYYNVNRPSEILGLQITQQAAANLVIGTSGRQGDQVTYGFGLEVMDSDNLTASTVNTAGITVPNLTVTNGPNSLPTAKFNVNTTNLFIGDQIVFTSSSTDPDGKIKSYIWDVEGDGFFNNIPSSDPTLEFKYTKRKIEGYDVRLKVVDDKGGEAISQPVKIFVDSQAQPPKAAFRVEPYAQGNKNRVRFINTSEADTEADARIISYRWDFDTAFDSSGDGIKDNDNDANVRDPDFQYSRLGTYNVKLTVTDNSGTTGEIVREVKVPLGAASVAEFTYKATGTTVVFEDKSATDLPAGVQVTEYVWDFNTGVDSDKDGKSDNDLDSTQRNPTHQYVAAGSYNAKLTIKDSLGNTDEVVKAVSVLASATTTTPATGLDAPLPGSTVASNLKAVLKTDPAPSGDDKSVYLSGQSGFVSFDFSDSQGSQIAYYSIDKNIYFDTNGNGVLNDDDDFKTPFAATYRTSFDKSWGRTVVKLTIADIYGNKNSVIQEIKFQ